MLPTESPASYNIDIAESSLHPDKSGTIAFVGSSSGSGASVVSSSVVVSWAVVGVSSVVISVVSYVSLVASELSSEPLPLLTTSFIIVFSSTSVSGFILCDIT